MNLYKFIWMLSKYIKVEEKEDEKTEKKLYEKYWKKRKKCCGMSWGKTLKTQTPLSVALFFSSSDAPHRLKKIAHSSPPQVLASKH
jgi:hypothetical protein